MNWFDGAAAAILLLFAWRGYRRGLLAWTLGLGASVLALALAIALTPILAPPIIARAGWARLLGERVLFVALLFLLRVLTARAARELAGALRPVLRALPPLALLDRLLGVIPSLVMGMIVMGLLLLAALLLPVDRRLHDGARNSLVGRTAISQLERATRGLPAGAPLAGVASLSPLIGRQPLSPTDLR